MLNTIEQLVPNLINYWPEFLVSVQQTLVMMLISGAFAIIFGTFFGVILVVTKKGGILENSVVNRILDALINIFRSIPFIILITAIMPVTQLISGSSYGIQGIIFPLVVATTPFFARQVDLSLSEVDPGLIEAAHSMGLTPLAIIFRVYLKESIPSLTRSTTITMVNLLGLTTLAGIVGGGGLGDFVIRYGHNKYMYDISIVSVLLILLMVFIIQGLGNIIIKKTSH